MAAEDFRAIRNATYRIRFAMKDTSGDVVTGLTVASSVGADQAAPGATGVTPTEIGSTGVYYQDLTASQMTGGAIHFQATAGGAVDYNCDILTEPALDSGVPQSGGTDNITLRVAADNTADVFNGAELEIVTGTGAGQIRTIVDYSTGRIATFDRPLTTGAAASDTYIIHPRHGVRYNTQATPFVECDVKMVNEVTAAAVLMQQLYEGGGVAGSVDDATPTDTSFDGNSALDSSDDHYNTLRLIMTSGTNIGVNRTVSDYTGSTQTLTLSSALPNAPANGDTFVILGAGSS